MRELRVERGLARDDAGLVRVFRDDPAVWLPELTRATDRPDRWHVYVWGGQVGVLVDLTLGRPWSDGDATWRSVTWEPVRWLGLRAPGFAGELTLARGSGAGPSLLLRGAYQPPGGLTGLLADRLLLHRLARTTARQLLADIAERLEAQARSARGRRAAR